MDKPKIFQLVAGYSRGDAISNVARTMRGIFRSWRHTSEIVCEATRVLAELGGDVWTLERCTAEVTPQDIVILHLSIGSEVNEVFKTLSARKVIVYHNITPPEFYEGLEQTRHLEEGREQTKALAGAADLNIAVSRFNASELTAAGYQDVQILPLPLDLSALRGDVDRATLQQYKDGNINVVFVGRCVPNKRIEDLLNTFYYFQNYVEPQSRFIHVGSFAGTEQYHAMLLATAHDLALERLDMIGSVSQGKLNAVYQAGDVFLSMSEHEGFCIPLIESMVHDVPVVAYDAGAVAETLDGAGILFQEKRFDLVAELLGEVVRNAELKKSLLEKQRMRLQKYESLNLAEDLHNLLNPLL